MNWSLFPPSTREVQMDEKWSFVGKKQANCNAEDLQQGDCWDHVAFDPEHRLVLSVLPAKRSTDSVVKLVEDFKRRTGGRIMNLITTDELPAYQVAILRVYGHRVVPLKQYKPGRNRQPYLVPPKQLVYATVHKTRENGRVVKVEPRLVFGTPEKLSQALSRSSCSKAVNTAFIERHNGTDRNRNSRKVRQTCGFSKSWSVHEAMTYFTMYSYNFCWPVRTLGAHSHRKTPAMAAGLADHVWKLKEWITLPAVQSA
jgi:IS1 family transposase